MYRAMYAYAWDVMEEGPAATGERLRQLGLDTLTLAASYHAGKFIRPRGSGGKVVFPEDGTIYFQPRLERYGAIRPLVNSSVAQGDWFSAPPEALGLRVNAWTVLLHNTPLGERHPDCAVVNAFGDRYPYSLCPSHPDVRAYAVALAADLGAHPGVTGLSLETPGYLPFPHGFHHEFAQTPSNPWMEMLLALSFSDACMARASAAGVPAAAVRDRVARALDLWFASEAAPDPDMALHWAIADLVADPDLVRFLRWRCDLVTSLVAEIRKALPEGTVLSVIPSVQRPSAAGWLEGSDLAALASVADRLEIPLYERSPGRALADLWDVRRRMGGETAPRCILRPPDFSDAETFKGVVAALRERGVTELAFYNDGLMRPHHLDWIGGALTA